MPTPMIMVTATLNDPSGTGVQKNDFLRFRLRNYSGWIPHVQLSSILVETEIDALPNSLGQISQQIVPNNVVTPPTTFYTVEAWSNGRITSSGNFLLNQPGPVDLDTASQLNIPPVPSGYQLVLQQNGADTSNQNLLNLINGTNVTITDLGDGTLQFSAAPSIIIFDSGGQGGFLGAGVPITQGFFFTNSAGPPSTTSDQITVFQFQLESGWTISKISARIATGTAGATVNFGIYSASGAKLIDSGALSAATTSSNESVTLGAPVTLLPGTYYFAQSSHFFGPSPTVAGLEPQFFGSGLLNLNAVRVGQTANSTSGGVMPATLGVISADTIGPVMCQAFFEV